MDLRKLLDRLVEPVPPRGARTRSTPWSGSWWPPHAHKVEVDRIGNLQAWLNPATRPLVMLNAHLDEVGLMVQQVEESGFSYTSPAWAASTSGCCCSRAPSTR